MVQINWKAISWRCVARMVSLLENIIGNDHSTSFENIYMIIDQWSAKPIITQQISFSLCKAMQQITKKQRMETVDLNRKKVIYIIHNARDITLECWCCWCCCCMHRHWITAKANGEILNHTFAGCGCLWEIVVLFFKKKNKKKRKKRINIKRDFF